jgi:pimeloyl-ACP methyl ester carboxylesterase
MSFETMATIRVPGANLYYEIRGAGPALVLIPAGAGDADSYRALAEQLAGAYRVVTYDRRGYSRSGLDPADQAIRIETHSNDVHHLLAALGDQPADVFGCSIGALIGLDFAVHHPTQVRTLVAHEPPIPALLPAAEQAEVRRGEQARLETLSQQGAGVALHQLASDLGIDRAGPRSNLGLPQPNAETAAANELAFFKHDVPAVARYVLDLDALRANLSRVVVAGGSAGREYFPYRCAVALAGRLGLALVEFPGGHAGFVDYPDQFAAKLSDVLAA